MAGEDYDEAQAVEEIVKALRPQMETDRFKHDPAAVRDVIKIVRAVARAEGDQRTLRPERLTH